MIGIPISFHRVGMVPPSSPEEIEKLQVSNEEYLSQVNPDESGAAPVQFWAAVWVVIILLVGGYWLFAG